MFLAFVARVESEILFSGHVMHNIACCVKKVTVRINRTCNKITKKCEKLFLFVPTSWKLEEILPKKPTQFFCCDTFSCELL